MTSTKLVLSKNKFKSIWQGENKPIANRSTSDPPTKLLTGVEVYQAEQLQPPDNLPNIEGKELKSLNQFNDNSYTSYSLDKSDNSRNSKVIFVDKSKNIHIDNFTINDDGYYLFFLKGIGVGLIIGSSIIFLAWGLITFL